MGRIKLVSLLSIYYAQSAFYFLVVIRVTMTFLWEILSSIFIFAVLISRFVTSEKSVMLMMRKQKEKLSKQSHSPLWQKE